MRYFLLNTFLNYKGTLFKFTLLVEHFAIKLPLIAIKGKNQQHMDE